MVKCPENEKVEIHNLKHLAVCSTEVSEFAKISAGRGVGEERNVKCQLLTVASRWTIWAMSGYGEGNMVYAELNTQRTHREGVSMHIKLSTYVARYIVRGRDLYLWYVEISTHCSSEAWVSDVLTRGLVGCVPSVVSIQAFPYLSNEHHQQLWLWTPQLITQAGQTM